VRQLNAASAGRPSSVTWPSLCRLMCARRGMLQLMICGGTDAGQRGKIECVRMQVQCAYHCYCIAYCCM
jgi:hypothetical protein